MRISHGAKHLALVAACALAAAACGGDAVTTEMTAQQILAGAPSTVADSAEATTTTTAANVSPTSTTAADVDTTVTADVFGCPEAWICDDIIESQIAFNGWDSIRQVWAGFDAMFAHAVGAANEGTPMVAYTFAPTAYITELRPGDNVYWMGVQNVLDDSNPLGLEGGEQWSQLDSNGMPVNAQIGEQYCPSAGTSADGLCQLGWIAADIQVTANNDFLAANPAAEALFEIVKLSVIEVGLAIVEQNEGAAPADLATDWIAKNRDTVDEWLDAARAAA